MTAKGSSSDSLAGSATTAPGASSAGVPLPDILVDEALVRALLEDQHPDLAGLELRLADVGWDNATFRLGDRLAVRMPRRVSAAPLLAHEQRWLPAIAARVPMPVSVPVRIGKPGNLFPWCWSVLPWLEGRPADLEPVSAGEARRFADFLRALHVPAPEDAPLNIHRGLPLQQHAAVMEQRLSRLRDRNASVGARASAAWHEALAVAHSPHRVWLHGDLHAQNVLVRDGAITGVIDWGDMTGGDPATDLAGIWMLFGDAAARADALGRYGATPEEVSRAKGRAVIIGTLLLESGLVNSPRHAAMGEATLARVAQDHLLTTS